MPRKTPVEELQQQEQVEEVQLRRSSRISTSSPVPTKVVTRRASASSDSTPKATGRRRSLSQNDGDVPAAVVKKVATDAAKSAVAKRVITRKSSKDEHTGTTATAARDRAGSEPIEKVEPPTTGRRPLTRRRSLLATEESEVKSPHPKTLSTIRTRRSSATIHKEDEVAAAAVVAESVPPVTTSSDVAGTAVKIDMDLSVIKETEDDDDEALEDEAIALPSTPPKPTNNSSELVRRSPRLNRNSTDAIVTSTTTKTVLEKEPSDDSISFNLDISLPPSSSTSSNQEESLIGDVDGVVVNRRRSNSNGANKSSSGLGDVNKEEEKAVVAAITTPIKSSSNEAMTAASVAVATPSTNAVVVIERSSNLDVAVVNDKLRSLRKEEQEDEPMECDDFPSDYDLIVTEKDQEEKLNPVADNEKSIDDDDYLVMVDEETDSAVISPLKSFSKCLPVVKDKSPSKLVDLVEDIKSLPKRLSLNRSQKSLEETTKSPSKRLSLVRNKDLEMSPSLKAQNLSDEMNRSSKRLSLANKSLEQNISLNSIENLLPEETKSPSRKRLSLIEKDLEEKSPLLKSQSLSKRVSLNKSEHLLEETTTSPLKHVNSMENDSAKKSRVLRSSQSLLSEETESVSKRLSLLDKDLEQKSPLKSQKNVLEEIAKQSPTKRFSLIADDLEELLDKSKSSPSKRNSAENDSDKSVNILMEKSNSLNGHGKENGREDADAKLRSMDAIVHVHRLDIIDADKSINKTKKFNLSLRKKSQDAVIEEEDGKNSVVQKETDDLLVDPLVSNQSETIESRDKDCVVDNKDKEERSNKAEETKKRIGKSPVKSADTTFVLSNGHNQAKEDDVEEVIALESNVNETVTQLEKKSPDKKATPKPLQKENNDDLDESEENNELSAKKAVSSSFYEEVIEIIDLDDDEEEEASIKTTKKTIEEELSDVQEMNDKDLVVPEDEDTLEESQQDSDKSDDSPAGKVIAAAAKTTTPKRISLSSTLLSPNKSVEKNKPVLLSPLKRQSTSILVDQDEERKEVNSEKKKNESRGRQSSNGSGKKENQHSFDNFNLNKKDNRKIEDLLAKYFKKNGINGEDEESSDDDDDSFDDRSNLLDDMAEEVDEEEEDSDDSNNIEDVGEEINTTESEFSHDDDLVDENDSFIDDDDKCELLSGNEYDLSVEENEDKKKRKSISKSPTAAVLAPNRVRILAMREDSDSNEEKEEENNDEATAPKAIVVEDMEDKLPVDKSGNEPTEEPKQQSPRRSLTKRSSITILENIRVDQIANSSLSDQINNVVNMFCTNMSHKGEVSVNVSLDCVEKSTATDSSNDLAGDDKTKESKKLKKKRKRKSKSDKGRTLVESSNSGNGNEKKNEETELSSTTKKTVTVDGGISLETLYKRRPRQDLSDNTCSSDQLRFYKKSKLDVVESEGITKKEDKSRKKRKLLSQQKEESEVPRKIIKNDVNQNKNKKNKKKNDDSKNELKTQMVNILDSSSSSSSVISLRRRNRPTTNNPNTTKNTGWITNCVNFIAPSSSSSSKVVNNNKKKKKNLIIVPSTSSSAAGVPIDDISIVSTRKLKPSSLLRGADASHVQDLRNILNRKRKNPGKRE